MCERKGGGVCLGMGKGVFECGDEFWGGEVHLRDKKKGGCICEGYVCRCRVNDECVDRV